MNPLPVVQALLLCCLLVASASEAGGPDSHAPPTHVAAVEHGEEGTRPVVIQVSNRRLQWAGDWDTSGVPVNHLSWSADGALLLYRQAGALMGHRMGETGSIKLAEGLEMPPEAGPDYALRPDGQQVALRRSTYQLELVSVDAGGGAAGSPRPIALPSGYRPVNLQWRSDGKQLYVLCRGKDSKTTPLLVRVDPTTGSVDTWPAPEVSELLGWSEQHGLLVAERAKTYGQIPGRIAEDGSYHSLRPAPSAGADTQEPPLDYVRGYLPAIDSFLMARASDDPQDPVFLTLVTPGTAPSRQWLKAFKRAGLVSFGTPHPWVAFVDRKPTERAGVGDIYIVRAGKEDARLIARSNARKRLFYGSPVPRPHKASPSASGPSGR